MSKLDVLHKAVVAYDAVTQRAAIPATQRELQATLTGLNSRARKRMNKAVRVFGFETVRSGYETAVGNAPMAPQRSIQPGQTTRAHPATLHKQVPVLPRNLRTARQLEQWLSQQGFSCKQQVGSHAQWEGPTGHKVTVPRHAGDIPAGTLAAIRRQVQRALES